MARILFHQAEELITNSGVAQKLGVAVTERDLGIITNGALLWDDKKGILWFGKTEDLAAPALKKLLKGAKRVSLKGQILTPALVDCHTHLVFAGSRHNEFAMKLEGMSYQQIAASGGGIVASVAATRAASEAELFKTAARHIEAVQRMGVGVLEIKSGYGLDWPTEQKVLKVIAKLKKKFAKSMVIQSTFLGAHAFPKEARSEAERQAYVDTIVNDMLPEVAKKKLADACDVFFDEGYFSEAQSRAILQKAKALGLKIKLHADELADTGGAKLAAELLALSADHLLKANAEGLRKMAEKKVVAVLLPGTAFYLGLPYASIEKMRQAGVPLALASDFNPGSSPSLNLPFTLSLACFQMRMTTAEAFAAGTFGGAMALGLHQKQGHFKVGLKPKMAVFDCPSYKALIAQFAHPGLCSKLY